MRIALLVPQSHLLRPGESDVEISERALQQSFYEVFVTSCRALGHDVTLFSAAIALGKNRNHSALGKTAPLVNILRDDYDVLVADARTIGSALISFAVVPKRTRRILVLDSLPPREHTSTLQSWMTTNLYSLVFALSEFVITFRREIVRRLAQEYLVWSAFAVEPETPDRDELIRKIQLLLRELFSAGPRP